MARSGTAGHGTSLFQILSTTSIIFGIVLNIHEAIRLNRPYELRWTQTTLLLSISYAKPFCNVEEYYSLQPLWLIYHKTL